MYQAEGLTLRVADNKAGYFGVTLNKPGQPKPYLARVWRGDKHLHLGYFATAEEAALCVARSPEGRKAAERAKAAAERKAAAAPAARRASQRQQEGHEVGAALAAATRAAALPAEAQHVQNEWKTVRL